MVFRSAQFHDWLNLAAQPIMELSTSENYKLRKLTLMSYFEATLKMGTVGTKQKFGRLSMHAYNDHLYILQYK